MREPGLGPWDCWDSLSKSLQFRRSIKSEDDLDFSAIGDIIESKTDSDTDSTLELDLLHR